MMDDELKKLVRDARNFHSGYVCQFAEWVLLPLWYFKPMVWSRTQRGPRQLDMIFFRLLKNGDTSRKSIAARLGIDEDEFIFSHLDVLVRFGYVAFDDGEYQLTTLGKDFESNNVWENCMEKIEKFPFVWNDMIERIEPESVIARKHEPDLEKLEHRSSPNEDTLLSALAKYFNQNAEHQKRRLTFYDAHYLQRSLRRYTKCVSLFYKSKQDDGDLHVDLRVYNKDEVSSFRLCKDLTRAANGDEHWREKFKEIYERQ